jgi:DNA-directed RNA polymerase specialized sigma24 family protein
MSDESVPSTPRSFDITQSAERNLVRREIIKLFRTTELAPRDILQRLQEHFYGAPVSGHDRRTFLRHATIWVREEALIRGAAAAAKPNTCSDLLKAFHYLDHFDPSAARILDLAHVAELSAADIADVLELAPEVVARKLQRLQTWLRRVAEGDPHTSYEMLPE